MIQKEISNARPPVGYAAKHRGKTWRIITCHAEVGNRKVLERLRDEAISESRHAQAKRVTTLVLDRSPCFLARQWIARSLSKPDTANPENTHRRLAIQFPGHVKGVLARTAATHACVQRNSHIFRLLKPDEKGALAVKQEPCSIRQT